MHEKRFSWLPCGMTLLILAALGGCGGSSGGGGTGLSATVAQVSALRTGGAPIVATQRTGSPPSGTAPGIVVNTSGVSIPGGSNQLAITSSSTYSALVVFIAGVDGYFELTGLTPTGSTFSITVVVTIGQHAPQTFTLSVAAGGGTGYGTAQTVPITLTTVGTGEVQINVSWDAENDLDLHVVQPTAGGQIGGTEIYYGARTDSVTNGMLDLDSNAACAIDHKKSENVTWPTGRSPHGPYIVRVDGWANCPPASLTSNYIVTINVQGRSPLVINGSFSVAGDYDHGGAGSGRTIYPSGTTTGPTFTY